MGIAESTFRVCNSRYLANSRIFKEKIYKGYADWAVRQLHDASVVLVSVDEDSDADWLFSQGMGVCKCRLEYAQEFAIIDDCIEIVASAPPTNEKI
jgi:hypothetical protein